MPEAPSSEDQPIDAPVPPENQDQPSGEEPASLADFDYSDIPDDLREGVEKRIKGFQASYTQAMQGVSEKTREAEQATQVINALQNPDPHIRAATLAQLGIDERAALEMFGYQPPEEEEEEEPDWDETRDPRVDDLLQEREQEKATEQLENNFSDRVEEIEDSEKRELTPGEHKALWKNVHGDLALYGTANVAEIWAEMNDLYSERQKGWIESKKTPRPPGGGKPGSRTVDLSKESNEEFVQRMASAVDEARASAQ